MLASLLKMAAPFLAGGGPAGMAARKGVDWLQERLEEPGDERVTSARLQAGDRLEVVARPAPTKAESKVEAELDAARAKLDAARGISPKQVKVAAKLERTQTRLGKAKDGSKKAATLADREADLLVRFDRMDVRRPDRRVAEGEVAELSERLETMRALALDAAGGSGSRKRTFYRAGD